MPLSIRTILTGAQAYANVYIGEIDQTAQIQIDVTQLTNAEIDSAGYLKPGVPFMSNGLLTTTPETLSTVAAGASHQNAAATLGNGTITGVSGGYGAPVETVTALCLTPGPTGTFSVTGSRSGYLGVATVGTPFTSPVINFTINDGATDWAALNTITFAVTPAGVTAKVFGVNIEPIKVAAGNDAGSIAAASTTFEIGLGLSGTLNKALIEGNLGRALTAAEVAGFIGTNNILLS
jgi:hypothetical protein